MSFKDNKGILILLGAALVVLAFIGACTLWFAETKVTP